MVRIRKTHKGNKFVFGVSTSDAMNLNVRIVEVNGEITNSRICLKAKHINKVVAWLETVKVNESFLAR